MVGAVGEMASMKRRSCGRQGRMGCVAPAVPSNTVCITMRVQKLSMYIARRTELKSPLFLLFLLCCRLPPKLGEMAKVYVCNTYMLTYLQVPDLRR